jgi:hypothetical protein
MLAAMRIKASWPKSRNISRRYDPSHRNVFCEPGQLDTKKL